MSITTTTAYRQSVESVKPELLAEQEFACTKWKTLELIATVALPIIVLVGAAIALTLLVTNSLIIPALLLTVVVGLSYSEITSQHRSLVKYCQRQRDAALFEYDRLDEATRQFTRLNERSSVHLRRIAIAEYQVPPNSLDQIDELKPIIANALSWKKAYELGTTGAEEWQRAADGENDIDLKYEFLERRGEAYLRARIAKINAAYLKAILGCYSPYQGTAEDLYSIDQDHNIRINGSAPQSYHDFMRNTSIDEIALRFLRAMN
jgi:hypothetical protein